MKTLASILPRFFTDRLQRQRQASAHTISSYRDTFRLLIAFAQEQVKKEPVNLSLDDINASLIGDFLDHIEHVRGNSSRTRNARLAAIHSFFRFVATEEPAYLEQSRRILAIQQRRCERASISFLSGDEIEAFLAAIDKSSWIGRRDFAMFLFMLQTGLRVSEVIGLKVQDVALTSAPHVRCLGKGRKTRCTPMTKNTTAALKAWINDNQLQLGNVLFTNRRGTNLSRDAIERRVSAYVKKAQALAPSLKEKRITPHSFRHTTAIQLLQAKVDTSIIALWLGHESIETTQIYLQADMSIKERALQQTAPIGVKVPRYLPSDPLLSFLESL